MNIITLRNLISFLKICTASILMVPIFNVSAQVQTFSGPPGGDVSAVAIHPTDTSIIFANTRFGYLFKSKDGGKTTQHINRDFSSGYYQKISIHPNNPNIIFAIGRLSVDGGQSWSEQLFSSYPVFNPQNPDVVFTSINNYLKISRDGGLKWDTLSIFDSDDIKFSICETDTAVLYLKSSNKIYKSINSGNDWIIVSDSSLQSASPSCLSTSINNPSTVLVGCGSGIYKSIDGGQSWQQKSSHLRINDITTVTDSLIYAVSGDYLWGEVGHFLKSTDEGDVLHPGSKSKFDEKKY